jgi:hypothetical protein
MIATFLRNPFSFGVLAGAITLFLGAIVLLMSSIIVLFSFPVIGEAVANWVGHSHFAFFIQLLY